MIDTAAHRARLQRRIAAKHERIAREKRHEDADAEPCDHDWRVFKETVRADNPKFEGASHFVVEACVKCQTKRRQKLVVEA